MELFFTIYGVVSFFLTLIGTAGVVVVWIDRKFAGSPIHRALFGDDR